MMNKMNKKTNMTNKLLFYYGEAYSFYVRRF
ncbi:hypothetical protein MTBGP_20690 [Moorella thermoacetica]